MVHGAWIDWCMTGWTALAVYCLLWLVILWRERRIGRREAKSNRES